MKSCLKIKELAKSKGLTLNDLAKWDFHNTYSIIRNKCCFIGIREYYKDD